MNPTDGQIAALAKEAKEKDYVVLGTYNAYCSQGQQKLLAALREANPRLIAVALRASYDYDCCDGVPGCILAYEYTEHSIQSLLAVLSGRRKATGLPPLAL